MYQHCLYFTTAADHRQFPFSQYHLQPGAIVGEAANQRARDQGETEELGWLVNMPHCLQQFFRLKRESTEPYAVQAHPSIVCAIGFPFFVRLSKNSCHGLRTQSSAAFSREWCGKC